VSLSYTQDEPYIPTADRQQGSNIANARVAGMNADLELTGPQYNMALTVFFFPYAIFEVPSNVVLKLMKPSIWISILMVTWGIVGICRYEIERIQGLTCSLSGHDVARHR
jgi:hypothetical protein